MLIDRNSPAYANAYKQIPEIFKHPMSREEGHKNVKELVDAEIGRYLAAVEGRLTWKQIFRLIKIKLTRK